MWPVWTGKRVAIVASGPSAKGAGVEKLKGRINVMAVKQSIDLCPWADAVYGCDAAWWNFRRGLPEFAGVKIAWGGDDRDNRPPNFPGLLLTKIPNKRHDHLMFGEVGVVGSGGSSGFQALNLAAKFGAAGILLVGFDVGGSGVHWYGQNRWNGANNPDEGNFRRWRLAFENAAVALQGMGVEVVNASSSSTLKCFPKASIDDALARWGL